MSEHYANTHEFFNNSLLYDEKSNHCGLLRLNRFIGVIDGGVENKYEKMLTWNLFQINCPSFRLETESREIDAIPRYCAKSWAYDDLTVSYLETANLKIKNIFARWMNRVLNHQTFARAYYDDVKANTFKIYALRSDGKLSSTVEIFYNLIPIEISSVDYDVSDEGTNVVLTKVKFKYVGHELTNTKENANAITED